MPNCDFHGLSACISTDSVLLWFVVRVRVKARSGSVTRGFTADLCNTPASCQLSADHDRLHQPIYSCLSDDVDDSMASSSIDVQFHSSATSSLASQHPHPQLSRWKPVTNIPARWSKEMSDPAAAGCCEFLSVCLSMHRIFQKVIET